MKFVMPDKRLLAVAIAAALVAMFPLFVVLAAQGQITEVNPSGVSGVTGTVSIDPDGAGPKLARDITIDAKTSWKVVGKKGKTGVVAKFNFTASDNDAEGSPVFTCNEVGGSLSGQSGVVSACERKLTAAELDIGSGLGEIITKVKDAAVDGLKAIGIDEPQYNNNLGSSSSSDDGS